MGGLYAPIVLTTNRDVSTIPPDLTKRMVTCHIDAAIPREPLRHREPGPVGAQGGRHRACSQRPIPEVRATRAEIDADDEFGAEGFPDLLARSSAVLQGVLKEALGDLRHFRDRLHSMLADAEDRVMVNRASGEIAVSFGGNTNQAAQFARSVPDFVLKGRFADVVRLDLRALEGEMGFAVGRRAGWWQRVLRR